MTARRGDWIETYTGRQFWPLDPRPEDIDARDIAHALSLICRFNGHCEDHYSVAKHSMLMVEAAEREGRGDLALWLLLHDASEAYICDVPRPLKMLPMFADYRAIEQRLQIMIYERFGLVGPEPVEVKDYDRRMLCMERALIMSKSGHAWGTDGAKPLDLDEDDFAFDYAASEFLRSMEEAGATLKTGGAS